MSESDIVTPPNGGVPVIPGIPDPNPVVPDPNPTPDPTPVVPDPTPVPPDPSMPPDPTPVIPDPTPVIPDPTPVVPDPSAGSAVAAPDPATLDGGYQVDLTGLLPSPGPSDWIIG